MLGFSIKEAIGGQAPAQQAASQELFFRREFIH
jgi:hypothetical protein